MNRPWENEPDREEFTHAGLHCILNRNHLGAWCGYAAVPKTHPFYGKGYHECDVDVHGGLTYARECQGEICHVVPEGEDDVWWLGFDCLHSGDYVPWKEKYRDSPELKDFNEMFKIFDMRGWHETYRDIKFVKDETKSLAEQLAAVKSV